MVARRLIGIDKDGLLPGPRTDDDGNLPARAEGRHEAHRDKGQNQQRSHHQPGRKAAGDIGPKQVSGKAFHGVKG